MRIFVCGLIAFSAIATAGFDPGPGHLPKEPTCREELSRWKLWSRRGFMTALGGAAVAGTYLGVEYANTDPNYQSTAQFDPSEMGNDVLGISVFGDSLARGEGYMPLPQHLWSVRTKRRGWPFDLDPSEASATTLYERIVDRNPALQVKVTNYAWPGAYVDPALNQSGPIKKYGFGVKDFQAQVAEAVAKPGPMSNLNIVFIGHCNVDWFYDCDNYGKDPEEYKQILPGKTVESYQKALEPLIDKAKAQKHPVTILVYGLINLRSVFIARDKAMETPEAYPSSDIKPYFPSLLKPYQDDTIDIAHRTNSELKKMVELLNRRLIGTNVEIIYSNALAEGDFSKVEYLSRWDALHPSEAGNTYISEIVYNDLARRNLLSILTAKDEELRAPRPRNP
jgi:hypothetical protein